MQVKMEKIRMIFCKSYRVYLTLLFISLIVVDKRVKYFSPIKCYVPNAVLALIGLGILIILCTLGEKIQKFINKFTTRECWFLLIILGMILYVVQMYIIYNTYYQAGWDCGMIAEMSEKVARGELEVRDSGYYSAYLSQNPHQAFMVFVLTIVKKISNHFGIQDMYFFSVMVGTLCVNITCILITLAVNNVKGRYYAFWTFVYAAAFLALSPQSSVPYTDIYAMVFNAMVLYLYTCKGILSRFKWIAIGITAFIGYHVKATAIICLIAIAICELLKINKTNVRGGADCKRRVYPADFLYIVEHDCKLRYSLYWI